MKNLYEKIAKVNCPELENKLKTLVEQMSYPIWKRLPYSEYEDFCRRKNPEKIEHRDKGVIYTLYFIPGTIAIRIYFEHQRHNSEWHMIKERKVFEMSKLLSLIKKSILKGSFEFIKKGMEYKDPIVLESNYIEIRALSNQEKGCLRSCGTGSGPDFFIKCNDRTSLLFIDGDHYIVAEKDNIKKIIDYV